MRVLAVSNFYPPHHIGGYELGCKDVVDRLVERDHEVSVLTSTHGVGGRETTAGIDRRLHAGGLSTFPKASLLEATVVEFRDHRILTSVVSQLNPQLISVWNLGGLADSLLGTIQRLKVPAMYHLSDAWLIHKLHRNVWRRTSHRRSKQAGKVILRLLLRLLLPESLLPDPGDFKPRHCHLTSKALKEQYLSRGFPLSGANVVYWGVPLDMYVPRKRKDLNNAVELLFVGQLEKHKGAHTALQAVAKLANDRGIKSARLTIVGAGKDPEYATCLRDIVTDTGLNHQVRFLGKVPRHDMPNVYNEHDILVFPSVWEEPFSLTLLEAMACGLAVVATTTGGSKEVLIDGWNSLTFRAEDADELAAQLERVIENEGLRQYVSENAIETVKSRFDITYMVDQIEDLFNRMITESRTEVAL